MQTTESTYDVVVIGGGPAGMMAAGRAAELGAKVLLLEKNNKLGKKLLITGGGRCNVTNAEFDTRVLLSKYKDAEQFLFSPFSQFGVEQSINFFHTNNLNTKIEAEKRVFPITDKAESVWQVLVTYLQRGKVIVRSNAVVVKLVVKNKEIVAARLENGEEVRGGKFILATGGTSRPETGSTGDGFKWLREIGHTTVTPEAALVPVVIKETWAHRLSGTSLPKAKLTVFQDGEKQDSREGKLLFTHFGLSGPLVLNMSSDIGELLKYGSVELSLDLMPGKGYDVLDKEIQIIFTENSNKKFKNSLSMIFPGALSGAVVEVSGIDPEKSVNEITREERITFGKLLKDLRMTVTGLLGMEKAVVTSGGLTLTEVDFKTMQSKLYPNFYVVGDVLNVDRPSGGYSLQLCWTTGYVAGTAAGSIAQASKT